MDKKGLFTKQEIEDFNIKFEIALNDLKKNEELMQYLYDHPIIFFRKYDIKIFEFIRKDRILKSYFVHSIRNAIRQGRGIFNNCLKCKIAVLFVIYATIGKLEFIIFEGILGGVDVLIENLKRIFGETGETIDKLFERFDALLEPFRPSHLAIIICRHLGYCP